MRFDLTQRYVNEHSAENSPLSGPRTPCNAEISLNDVINGEICTSQQTTERLSIVFHWFIAPSIQELFEWIIAINGIIPANKQIFTDEDVITR